MEEWLTNCVWPVLEIDQPKVHPNELLMAKDWLDFLNMSHMLQKRLKDLIERVKQLAKVSTVYPCLDKIMYWSYCCSPSDVKVIILGQDPYHSGQATGLAFSVDKSAQIPPSLRNIFTELIRSGEISHMPLSGCLEKWSKQGVLLLNTVLTVEKGKPGSHSKFGWTALTDFIISCISERLTNCVFMLWGCKAIEKEPLINRRHHLVLKSQHPSPLAFKHGTTSLTAPFKGCNHFTEANNYLSSYGKNKIDWSL